MTKKNFRAAMVIVVVAILAMMALNPDAVSLGYESGSGLVVLNQRSINSVIDFYMDKENNFYYLDYRDGQTYLYKLSGQGRLLFKTKLPTREGDQDYYYKKIVVDDLSQIYLSVTITPTDNKYIAKEAIQKYDNKGKYLTNIYEIIPKEAVRMGNPFSALSGRLINMQLINDRIYVFDKRSDGEIVLLEIDDRSTQEATAKDRKILYLDTASLREIIYTANDEIYLVNRKAEIYRINEYEFVQRVEMARSTFARPIPYTFSTDQRGNLFFTDPLNNKFMMLSSYNSHPQVLYELSQTVDEENQLALADLRNIRVFNDGVLVGHSPVGYTKHNYLAVLVNGTGNLVNQVKLSGWQAVQAYGLWVLAAFLGAWLLVWFIKVMFSRIGLLSKQILIFLPIFLAVMLSLVLLLAKAAEEFTIDAAYNKIVTSAAKTAELMDGERFANLDYLEGYLGSDYQYLAEQVRVGRGGIYYVTYSVENERIYVGISTSIQAYTPIEFLYARDTVETYYQTIRTGEVQMGSTIDSLGEWMFALAPIKNAEGQIVGVLEHGLHKGEVDAQVAALKKNLIAMVLGIALIVATAYVVMLKYSLRSLEPLKRSVAEVAAGQWDTKVNIKTRDEFRDIGLAFNKMSGRIQTYFAEITKLNQAYLKFVPQDFFALLGKDSVLDVRLGEQVLADMTIMYINIRSADEQAKQLDVQASYDFINTVLETIARVVNKNQGVIERFEGAGVIALFKNHGEGALNSALGIMEALNHGCQLGNQQVELGITLNRGQILLGIVGHERQLATTVISEEVQNTHLLERVGTQLGIQLLLADSALQELNNPEKFRYRYAGRVKDISGTKSIQIYEFFDGYDQGAKDSRLKTKSIFEQGVALYQAGDFAGARSRFISVIRMNRHDQLAKNYLFLCEKYQEQEVGAWLGFLETIQKGELIP